MIHSVPIPSYIELKCKEECALTLHGFAKALAQLPAMFLKQPVPDVILAEREEKKKTKNIPIIRGALPVARVKNKIKTKLKLK